MKNITKILISMLVFIFSVSCVKMDITLNFEEYDKGTMYIDVSAAKELVTKDMIEKEINSGIKKVQAKFPELKIENEYLGESVENFSLSENGKDEVEAINYLINTEFDNMDELNAILGVLVGENCFKVTKDEKTEVVTIKVVNPSAKFIINVNGKILTVNNEKTKVKNKIVVVPGLNTTEIKYKKTNEKAVFYILSAVGVLVLIALVSGAVVIIKRRKK